MKLFPLNHFHWTIGSLIIHVTIASFPSEAANFNSFSQINLEINNFNQSPQEIFADGNGSSFTNADEGVIWADLDVDSNFIVENTSIFAYSQSQTTLFGNATRYSGEIDFSSILLGKFSLLKGESLKFDLSGFLTLINATDDLQLGNLSASGNINLFLRDTATQEVFDIVKFLGVINTTSLDKYNQDFYLERIGKNVQLTNYSHSKALGGIEEGLQTIFAGSFEMSFDQDTQVELVIQTQFCNYASNVADRCVSVREPSNSLAVVVVFMGLGSLKIFSTVAKSMNKFIS